MLKNLKVNIPTSKELWDMLPDEVKTRVQTHALLPQNTYGKWWRGNAEYEKFAGEWAFRAVHEWVCRAMWNTVMSSDGAEYSLTMLTPKIYGEQVEIDWGVVGFKDRTYERVTRFCGGIVIHSDGSVQSHT